MNQTFNSQKFDIELIAHLPILLKLLLPINQFTFQPNLG